MSRREKQTVFILCAIVCAIFWLPNFLTLLALP